MVPAMVVEPVAFYKLQEWIEIPETSVRNDSGPNPVLPLFPIGNRLIILISTLLNFGCFKNSTRFIHNCSCYYIYVSSTNACNSRY